MASPQVAPDLASVMTQMGGQPPKGQDPTASDPSNQQPKQNAQQLGLTPLLQQKLIEIKKRYKTIWMPIRRNNCRRALRAFEFLKGNCYISFDYDNFEFYDPIESALGDDDKSEDLEMYRFVDNIYQMLCLSFMAALSPRAPVTRYQPYDAQDELDIKTAERASTMMQLIEEQNDIKSLQKLELLHLWTGGVYFSYTRYIVDEDRAGITKQPVTQMVPTQVTPDRFECPKCGTTVPDSAVSPFGVPRCPKCGAELRDEDWHPGDVMEVPQTVGQEEIPNGMTKIDVFGLLNVDAAPYAQDLFQTPILDLEMECDVADVRSRYPQAWDKIQANSGTAGVPEAEADRMARLRLFSTGSSRGGYLSDSMPTFSRCWIQPWAFNILDDKTIADQLREIFPRGAKLVSLGDEFLEAAPEKLTDVWSWCPQMRGMGLYPFAVGDAALDVQERINDVTNLTHEHMARNASPMIMLDGDALDGDALNGKKNMPGSFVNVLRRGPALVGKPLSDLVFQPEFHVDNNIYTYGESLVARAQLISGVQPQIFGGSDPNVKTAHGQSQMLNTALGRLKLFWDQIGIEHAHRSYLAVKCMTNHMDDELRVVVDGDTESGYENEFVLLTEMQGQFHAYPETDEDFPSTYGEIRDRMLELINDPNMKDNPFLLAFLSDPDNQKLIARYILPPDVTLPGDAERSKIKQILARLAKDPNGPTVVMGPTGPLQMPTIAPDPDFDDMGMWVMEAKKWGQRNWEAKETNPQGYDNVRAALRLASQLQAQQQVAQALQAAPPQGPGPGAGGPPPGPAHGAPGAPGKVNPVGGPQ